MMSKLRLTHGLHWRSTHPELYMLKPAKSYAIRLTLVALSWALFSNHQFSEEQAQELSETRAALASCLNGELRLQKEDSGKGDLIFDTCKGVQTIPVPRGHI